MRFAYLDLADSANTSSEGKVNILGAGARVLNTPSVPFSIPVTLVAKIEAEISEAGDYPFVVHLKTPTGRQDLFEDKKVSLRAPEVPEAELPLALNIQLALHPLTITEPGLHRVHVRFGRIRKDCLFIVRVIEQQQPVAS